MRSETGNRQSVTLRAGTSSKYLRVCAHHETHTHTNVACMLLTNLIGGKG